ncbi:hypothetical protein ACFOW1_08930 [Parasediminibacterium paludis]|uniref:Uncharacterized protein n=1 Tax=Parasediminibacterium paludis TaxID=908966 RepID=A0ABV8PXY5_9BACT
MKQFATVNKVIIATIIAAVVFMTCTKEYSYEGGISINAATYDISNICTNAVVNGNYFVDEAVDSLHNIQLQVNVSKVGSYNISSANINGIQFTAIGTFSNVGLQTVILTALGTPINAGTFNYNIGNNNCIISILVKAKRIKMASFNISGQPRQCATAIIAGNYVAGKAMTIANSVNIQVNVATIGAYFISTDTLDGIYFSASGSFTGTGNTLVTLQGNGTPTSPANLLFTPKSDTNFCSFPLTVLPPEPLAIYVLESGYGTNTPCIYTVNGSCFVDKQLTGANTITMNVYVANTGNFAITTDTLNGIAFGYSGTFTAVGSQKVTLIGSGTPIKTGSFSLTPTIVGPHPLGGQVCGVVITVN